ncbi:MAG: M48 family metallopeptidase [Thermodesulforhabdaceae bacterium]|jgi:predicted metal-dependent hydrolase
MKKTQERDLPHTDSILDEAVARDVLISEINIWARRIGVEDRIREIHIRPMKYKWASCSSRGRLTFDSDLLRQPADFRREVIVHELLHLKVPNHSRLFKVLLKAYLSGTFS